MGTTRALAALVAATALIVGACQGGAGRPGGGSPAAGGAGAGSPAANSPAGGGPAGGSPAGGGAAAGTPLPGAADFKACEVSDTGGIDDKGFNQNAYAGLEGAKAEFGIGEIKFLESTSEADYNRNIQTFINEKCDLIVTVGFLLGDATEAAAKANPKQKFAIVDFAYDPVIPNVAGIVFAIDEATMLGGYLAAGMSKTGKVATFGGIDIPPVRTFMEGFAAGVNYYNKQKGKNVQLLGWDPKKKSGSFTGDFQDTAKGRQVTEGFIQEGADVVMAVAGPVGLGAAAAVQDAEGVMFIGVDVDQAISAPEYRDVMLSSILKRIDNGVKGAIRSALEGRFKGGVQVNTLKNEGVGLAPYHEFENDVPQELDAEIDALRQAIASGQVKPADWYEGAPGQ